MNPRTHPKATACFTFDNLGEAADVGAGSSPALADPHPSIEHGLPNLLRLLDRHRVRSTFFVEGWNGQHHPEAVREIVTRGHELGMHGWTHENWSSLSRVAEEERATRATAALEEAAGTRPIGFRAPGGSRSDHTEPILLSLGYRYDASLGDGMTATVLPSGIAQIPFVWSGVDGAYYLRREPTDPDEVRDRWLATLTKIAADGGLFVLICHPFITGVDEKRLAALDAVIAAACADPRISIRTTGDVASELLASNP